MNMVVSIANYLFAVSMPFTHIVGYAATAVAALLIAHHWAFLKREKIFWLITLFLCYGVGADLFSPKPGAGFEALAAYFAHWLLPFVLGYALADLSAVKRAVGIYYGSLTVVLIVSLCAYVGLIPSALGTGNYLVQDGLLKGLRSHIALASLCVIWGFISASFALLGAGSCKRRIVFGGMTAFFAACLLLAGSRGYYIAAGVAIPAFGIYWLAATRQWKYAVLGVGGFLLLAGGLYALSPTVRDRIHRTGRSDTNITDRLALYSVALSEIKARPVFGFGPGQGIRQTQFFNRLPEEQRRLQHHPHLHSFYLNFTADFGLLGFLLFGAMMAAVFQKLWSAVRFGHGFVKMLSFGLLWGIIAVILGDSFDTLLRGPGTAMEIFWLVGLIARQTASGVLQEKKG